MICFQSGIALVLCRPSMRGCHAAVFVSHLPRYRPTAPSDLLFAVLVVANLLAWIWAFVALRENAVLFGSALLAYTFGLRHAVDADHIAAIDNSTRKLMQEGKRPVAVGLFFSLGHSTVVVLMSVAVGFATRRSAHASTISRPSAALSAPAPRPRSCSSSPCSTSWC